MTREIIAKGLIITLAGEYSSLDVGKKDASNKHHKYHIGKQMDLFESLCGREHELESVGDSEYPFKVANKKICKLCLAKVAPVSKREVINAGQ